MGIPDYAILLSDCEGLLTWLGWILTFVFVGLPLALLCYSVVTTGFEIGRKAQPFVDSFFDFVAIISGYSRRRTQRTQTDGRSKE